MTPSIEVLEADTQTGIGRAAVPQVGGRPRLHQAHILRSRYRFAGEIRATGEVLVDMMPLAARTGFDAVVLRADQDRAAPSAIGLLPRAATTRAMST